MGNKTLNPVYFVQTEIRREESVTKGLLRLSTLIPYVVNRVLAVGDGSTL